MDLDDELNRLFKDERLDIRVAPDADTHVVQGAKRVKRRRVAAMSAAGVLSAALLAGGAFVLAQPGPTSSQTADQPPLPVDNSSSSSGVPPTGAPGEPTALPTSSPVETRPLTPETSGNSSRPTTMPPTSTLPPVAPGAQLGPRGFANMALGMTEEELFATGQVQGPPKPNPGCISYSLKTASGTVWLSADKGVVGFVMRGGVATPERVGIGSTTESVEAAYADFDGTSAKVPTNAAAIYKFGFAAGKVSSISLLTDQQACVS
ncbi:hypothetical protein LWC34_19325 [Kibdelosporangium philippinense]|uniref:Uncharacterized protein n=1 Tax=Kibdelosporangium philippinense TaxID=211113 RepID=A0ABS8ZE48_9PSEU|nr:hypothetical protein [Kibdelosporangium philippinense]MCE7004961.1 hypothetical protein [Kibdelosporangium philippinense]